MSRRVAEAAFNLKLLSSKDVEQVDGKEADKLLPHGSVLYGTNARGPPNRAKAVLGWAPREESLEDEIRRVVGEEARALGRLRGKLPAPRL